MDAKEYAKYLVRKGANEVSNFSEVGYSDLELGKPIAILIINEMLDFRNKLYMYKGGLTYQWLQQVKTEIEKL